MAAPDTILTSVKKPFVWSLEEDTALQELNKQKKKRLNSCQALSYTRFNFSLSYFPRSRNVQSDVLSRKFTVDKDQTEDPGTILP